MFGKAAFLSLILTGFLLSGQKPADPCKIKLKVKGLRDTTLYLANYFGNKILRVDSLRLDHTGTGTLARTRELGEGLYLFYLNDKNYFEFLVGCDQQFSIEADFAQSSANRYTGSEETAAFHGYQVFLGKQKARQTTLQNRLKAVSGQPDSVKILQGELTDLNNAMEKYWQDESNRFKGTFLADFYRSMMVPSPPDPVLPPAAKNPDSIRWVYGYNYTRDHYWDQFNFARAGMIRTPLFQEKLETYFKRLLIQMPDSLINPMIRVLEKSKQNEEVYKYVLLYLLNESLQSQIMGMDKAFVVLSEKYVLNDKKSWPDSVTYSKIRERTAALKPNLIGNLAPELKLPDSEDNYYSLRQLNARFTILYFWEPDCSHCQKTTPSLNKDLYQKFKNNGVQVFAVLTQNNRDKWMKAIREYNIQEWTNVWDPRYTSDFRRLYDVTSTPIIFILDKNKKIIAKRLDVESSVKFLNAQLEMNSK
jgi:peroxiredoxin